jgi:activator of HSP90 ATPase
LDEEEKKQLIKQVHKKQREAVEGFLKLPEIKRAEKDLKILNEFSNEMNNL